MPEAVIQSTPDPQNAGWQNATCPYCQQTTTWDSARRTIVSDCRHTAGRLANGMVLFNPSARD
jgi:hypothetical protein